MNIQSLIHSDISIRLGWILLHSLWQLTLIGLIAGVVRAAIPMKSQTRYAFTYAMLLCMAAAPLGTLFFVPLPTGTNRVSVVEQLPQLPQATPPVATIPEVNFQAPIASSPKEIPDRNINPELIVLPQQSLFVPVVENLKPVPLKPVQIEQPGHSFDLKAQLLRYSVWLTPFWLAGVLILSLRQLGGWVLTRRVLKFARPITDSALQNRLAELAKALKLRRAVKFVQSTLADVPMVIGVFRPVLILPVSLLTGLTPAQCDAILAHELAHIRRYDFLLNLMQVMIETLLFYHPAIWWISRRIRLDREFCCDDIAAQFNGYRLALAEGLAVIEATRLEKNVAPLAVTALGNKKPGITYRRIKRILNPASLTERGGPMKTISSLLILTIILITAAGGYHHSVADADSGDKKGKQKQKEKKQQDKKKVVDKSHSDGILEIHCRVYDKQGKPVAGAVIQSYTRRHRVYLVTGGKQESPRCPTTKSNAQGKFGLPERKEAYRILVTHKSGVASMSCDDLIQSKGRINLQPWGRVEGLYTIDGQPNANQKMTLSMTVKPWNFARHIGRHHGLVNLKYSTSTDQDGKFSFEHVPPFIGRVSRSTNKKNYTQGIQFTCQAGSTTHVSIEEASAAEADFASGTMLLPPVKKSDKPAPMFGSFDAFTEPAANPPSTLVPVPSLSTLRSSTLTPNELLTQESSAPIFPAKGSPYPKGNPYLKSVPVQQGNPINPFKKTLQPDKFNPFGGRTKPASWELSQRYDSKWLRTWFATHDALPDPISVPAVQGVVYGQDNREISGASIITYTPADSLKIGAIGKDFRYPVSNKTTVSKSQGKFTLAQSANPYRILVTHQSGVSLMTHEELLKNRNRVILLPWAKIEGAFILGSEVQANKKIKIYIDTSPWSFFDVSPIDTTARPGQLRYEYSTTTDKNGHFTFDNVLPLNGMIYALLDGSIKTNGIPFTCKPGKTTTVMLGKGRSVTGRLRMLDNKNKVDWTKAQLFLTPYLPPPAYMLLGDEAEMEKWLQKWIKTEAGQAYEKKMKQYPDLTTMNCHGKIDRDGSFIVHGVNAGRYIAVLQSTSGETRCQTIITIDASTGSQMNLGVLYLEPFNKKKAQNPPSEASPVVPDEAGSSPNKKKSFENPKTTPAEKKTGKPPTKKPDEKKQKVLEPDSATNISKKPASKIVATVNGIPITPPIAGIVGRGLYIDSNGKSRSDIDQNQGDRMIFMPLTRPKVKVSLPQITIK